MRGTGWATPELISLSVPSGVRFFPWLASLACCPASFLGSSYIFSPPSLLPYPRPSPPLILMFFFAVPFLRLFFFRLLDIRASPLQS